MTLCCQKEHKKRPHVETQTQPLLFEVQYENVSVDPQYTVEIQPSFVTYKASRKVVNCRLPPASTVHKHTSLIRFSNTCLHLLDLPSLYVFNDYWTRLSKISWGADQLFAEAEG